MALAKVLFEKQGVFIHTTIASVDEDALVPGKIQVVQKADGIYIEWKPSEEEAPANGGAANGGATNGGAEADWHVVDTVSYNKAGNGDGREGVKVNAKQPRKGHRKPERQKYVINFDVTDLKSFKRSKPNLGWSYLIFILKCGTTCPALHFHQGGTKAFIKQLEHYLNVKKSPTDSCLFLVREQDPAALSKSFDELELFENQSRDIVSKFFHDPYSTTLGGFSKVTKFLQDVLLVPETEDRPDSEVAAILQEDIEGININTNEEPGFEIVTTEAKLVDLGKRPEVKRSEPLTPAQWSQHMDKEGCVKDVDKLKEAIFRGGVDASIRIEVWKFLLGYYSWDSTYKSRTEQRKKKVDDYFRMKVQWKTVTEDQEMRFSMLRERKNLIDKDVTRTDRTHSFFQGDDNPNIQVLYDVLATYCMYNFDLGYVQGMSDLLAPILVVMENEVDAFWCFAGFMEQVAHHFEMTQEGMKNMLSDLHTLVKFVDPKLCNYLESHESGNMYFCFRWLLIFFKREFSFPDIMRLWEVMWTGKPCKNYHFLISLAILDTEKNVLIENNFGLTEILKHINDISGTIDLEDTLRKAEGMYLQVANCPRVPPAIAEMLGLEVVEGAAAARSIPASRSSTPGTPENAPGGPGLAVPSNSHTDTALTSPEDEHPDCAERMDMFS